MRERAGRVEELSSKVVERGGVRKLRKKARQKHRTHEPGKSSGCHAVVVDQPKGGEHRMALSDARRQCSREEVSGEGELCVHRRCAGGVGCETNHHTHTHTHTCTRAHTHAHAHPRAHIHTRTGERRQPLACADAHKQVETTTPAPTGPRWAFATSDETWPNKQAFLGT